MADINRFVVKVFDNSKTNDVQGELQTVIEFDLPSEYDFDKLQKFLESEEGFEITNSYYHLDRNYSHTEMGAGASSIEIILNIWNKLPEELRTILIEKVLELGLKLPVKIVKHIKRKKLEKWEKERVKKQYGFKKNEIEVHEIQKENGFEIRIYEREP